MAMVAEVAVMRRVDDAAGEPADAHREEVRAHVESRLPTAIQPPYHAVAEPYTVDGRHILVLWARGGQTRPYKARVLLAKSMTEMAYYIRKGSSTSRARNADERELLSLAATVPFDDRVNQQASVSDLSRELIGAFLSEIDSDLSKPARKMSLEALGRQLGVVAGQKILRAMKANGSPLPIFEFNEDHSYFITRLRVHPAVPRAAPLTEAVPATPVVTPHSGSEPTQSPTQSTDPVERLLLALEFGEQSAGDLRQATGIRHRPTFRKNYLHPAMIQHFIEYTLPEKPNSRLQKYRLTAKGRAWLAAQQH